MSIDRYIENYGFIKKVLQKIKIASREDILDDAEKLDLDMNLINDFLSEDVEADDVDDDDDFYGK